MSRDVYDSAGFDSDDDDWDSQKRRRSSSRRGETGLARGRPRRATAAGSRRGRYESDGVDSRGDENVLPQLSRMGYTSYGGAYKDEHLLRPLDEITSSNAQKNPNALIPGSKMTEAEFNNLPVDEQRRQRRLIRNRLSAHLHRQRQKAHIEALETQVVEMATIIEEYKARVQHMLQTTGNINLPPVAVKGTPVDTQTPRPLFPHNLLTYQPPHIPGLLGFSSEVSAIAGLIRAKTLHGCLYPHNASTSLAPMFSPSGDLEIPNSDINAARSVIMEMFADQDALYHNQATTHVHHPEAVSEQNAQGNYAIEDSNQHYQPPAGDQGMQGVPDYEQAEGHYYPATQTVHANQGLSLTIPTTSRQGGSVENTSDDPENTVQITIPHNASLTPKPLGEPVSSRPIRSASGYANTYQSAAAEEPVHPPHAEAADTHPEVKPTIIPGFPYRAGSYNSVSGGGEKVVAAPPIEATEVGHDTTPQNGDSSKDEADWKTPSFGLDLLSTSASYYESANLDLEPKYQQRKIEVGDDAPRRSQPTRPYHPTSLPSLQTVHTFSELNPHLQRTSTVLSQSQNEPDSGTPRASVPMPKSYLPKQPTLRRTATFASEGAGTLPSQPSFSSPLASSIPPYS